MRCSFRGFIVFVIFVCCIVAGCTSNKIKVAGEKGKSAQARLAIQELVIRNVVMESRMDDVIFISFGDSWEQQVDPPAGFLERLKDMDVVFAPVTHYNERSTSNPLLVIAKVTEWISDTEARVKATRFRLGVGGADGFTTTVRWSGGAWTMAKPVDYWSG